MKRNVTPKIMRQPEKVLRKRRTIGWHEKKSDTNIKMETMTPLTNKLQKRKQKIIQV
jgi:hypothetical protein